MTTVFSFSHTPHLGYQDWQARFLAWSFLRAEQPGKLVGLLATDTPGLAPRIPGMDVVPTPRFSPHPATKDDYSARNKPGSIAWWLRHDPGDPDETILVLDPDCIFVRPVDAVAQRGQPQGEHAAFMGVSNEPGRTVIERHCRPDAAPLVRAFGVPMLIRRGDLASMADGWTAKSDEMRAHPKTRADVNWTCEMWAACVAGAEAGLEFAVSDNTHQFPTEPYDGSPIIHYAYEIKAPGFLWKKYDYKPWSQIPTPPDSAPETGRMLIGLLNQAASELS